MNNFLRYKEPERLRQVLVSVLGPLCILYGLWSGTNRLMTALAGLREFSSNPGDSLLSALWPIIFVVINLLLVIGGVLLTIRKETGRQLILFIFRFYVLAYGVSIIILLMYLPIAFIEKSLSTTHLFYFGYLLIWICLFGLLISFFSNKKTGVIFTGKTPSSEEDDHSTQRPADGGALPR